MEKVKVSVKFKKPTNEDQINHLIKMFDSVRSDYQKEKDALKKKYFGLLTSILEEIHRLQKVGM